MKKISTFLTAFCLFLGSHFLEGQNFWEALEGPFGVSGISLIAPDAAGRLFMIKNDKILKSTDQGNSWSECQTGIGQTYGFYQSKFMLSPSGEFYLAVGYSGSVLYRYLPGSDSWLQLTTNSWGFGDYDGFDIDQQGKIWASSDQSHSKLHYSINGGQNFVNVPLDAPVDGWFDFLETFNDDHNLIAVSYGASQKLYHFNSSGQVKQVLAGSGCQYVGFNPQTGTAYYGDYDWSKRSTDGGLTWKNLIFDPQNPQFNRIQNMTFESSGRIWVHSYYGMFRSDDDGATWTKDAEFEKVGGEFFWTAPKTWFVLAGCGFAQFARSSDDGVTWTDLSGSFREPSVSEIQKDADGNLFARTCRRDAFEISSDDGKSWSDLTIFDSVITHVISLAIRADGVKMAYCDNQNFYRSLDNGATWSKIKGIDPTLNLGSAKFYTDWQGAFYYFGSWAGVQQSTDAGETWKTLNTGTFDNIATFHPNGDFFVTDFFNLFRYSAAENMMYGMQPDTNTFFEAYAAYCSSSGTLFVSGAENFSGLPTFYRIADGTGDWVPIPFFDDKLISQITSNSDGDVFVLANNSMYKSEDDGNSWFFVADVPANYPSVFTCTSDQHLYLGFQNDVIYRSTQPTAESNQILGKTWLDKNDNCQPDPTESAPPTTIVTATGSAKYTGFAGQNGNFKFSAPSGNYLLNVVPPNALFKPCFSNVPIVLNGPNDTATANLPLKIVSQCPYLSVNLSTPMLRRCFENTYAIVCRNAGTATATDVYVEVTLDSLFDFVSSTVPVFSKNGLVYTFKFGDLAAGQSSKFWIKIKVSCDASLGQQHCMAAKIFPETFCQTELPNFSENLECRENIGSFDPNDKTAFVAGFENPGFVKPSTDIEYFIRFQNTGTDTAFRVVVEDRLPTNLDLTTLTPLVSSHPFSLELRDQRTVRFVFENILLPDSNINSAASNGFVKFRISQMPGTPLGTVIKNEADIFFDFNSPVRTNESKLVVGTTETKELPTKFEVAAFPNPFQDAIYFEIRTAGFLPKNLTLRLFDILGRQVRFENFSGYNFVLPRQNLQSGMYFFKIESGGEVIGTGKVLAN